MAGRSSSANSDESPRLRRNGVNCVAVDAATRAPTSPDEPRAARREFIPDEESAMKIFNLRTAALIAALVGYGGIASAAVHAPANSTISNVANVNFDVGGTPQPTETSNTDTITVDELVDVDVTRQSATPLVVLSPATDQTHLFRVTSLGNGSEQFNLTGNLAVGGNDFNPTGLELYIDDGDGIFEPGTDDGLAVTSVTLAAETFEDVWFSVDIPAALVDNDLGNVELTATSNAGTGAPGSEIGGAGDGGTGLVFGPSQGDDVDTAAYQVSNIAFTVTKSSVVVDPFAGSQPVPGATITYTITVTTTGTASATNVVIDDDIPANTTFVSGSVTFNTVVQSNGSGDDTCDFNVNNPGGIYCDVGTLTGVTSTTVTFQVTIN